MLKIGRFVKRFCITLVVLLHLQDLPIWTLAQEQNPVCTTQDCQKVGYLFSKYMNKLQNPCIDFYDYVCHGWAAQHPQPKYEEFWRSIRLMENNAYAVARRLLEDQSDSNVKVIKDVKALYRACLKFPSVETLYFDIIKNIMKNVGNWPMFLPNGKNIDLSIPWWAIDIQYIKRTGESALFHMNIIADKEQSNRIIPLIKMLMSPYGMLLRNKVWGKLSWEKNYYKNFLKLVIQSVAPENPQNFKSIIDKDLNDVINFRENIREIIVQCNRNEDVMTIENLQIWYNLIAGTEGDVNNINWMQIIRALYKNSKDPYGNDISSTERVMVQKAYIILLQKLLKKTPNRIIANHIHLYFAERHIRHTEEMEAELYKSVGQELYKSGVIRFIIPRWRWCINHLNLRQAIRGMYVIEVFPPQQKTAVGKLLEEAKSIMQEQIIESTWLSLELAAWSIGKIKATTYSIGYPDWYNSKKAISEPLDLDPLEPNAYYAKMQNRVYISAAYLQLPVYSPNLPYVINYGGVMNILAHELYHAFDTTGITYNQFGKTPGWPKEAVQRYQIISQCFKKLYDGFRKIEFARYNVGIWDRLTKLPETITEDISDAMALKLVYRMYKAKFKQQNEVCPVLPGFEKMSCDQLFFIAFANDFCAQIDSNTTERRLLFSDNHSLPRIRANAAVANMKEFTSAFSCRPEDPLYAKNTCDIWHGESSI